MQRSKVAKLPTEVRAALDQRLLDGGFSDYEGLSKWLAAQGYEISESSVYRYGAAFERRVAALKSATDQARAVMQASPDDEGAMTEALTRLVQERLFTVLVDMQAIDPESVTIDKITRAVADLTRSAISVKRFRAEVRDKVAKEAAAIRSSVVEGRPVEEQLAAIDRLFGLV